MSDGSSMYTGSFSRQAVRIRRSISVAALWGVSLACAAVTCAKDGHEHELRRLAWQG